MASVESFLKNNADMIDAAARCLESKQLLPTLVLIYSHIDTLSWAASWPEDVSVRRRFEDWTKRWLFPHLSRHSPELTATDLYAARCGVLHSLTGKSDLSRSGQARELAYAWGTAPVDILHGAIRDSAVAKQLVGLHCQDLLESLRLAVADIVAASKSDSTVEAALTRAAGEHYENIRLPEPEEGSP